MCVVTRVLCPSSTLDGLTGPSRRRPRAARGAHSGRRASGRAGGVGPAACAPPLAPARARSLSSRLHPPDRPPAPLHAVPCRGRGSRVVRLPITGRPLSVLTPAPHTVATHSTRRSPPPPFTPPCRNSSPRHYPRILGCTAPSGIDACATRQPLGGPCAPLSDTRHLCRLAHRDDADL